MRAGQTRRAQRARAKARKRLQGVSESSGFPRGVLVAFLGVAVGLGLLLSWALGISVQVQSPGAPVSLDSTSAPGVDELGFTVLTENTVGTEVQKLIETGTLQNPATFDVSACLGELGVDDSVLMLEKVAWSDDGLAWLIVHSPSSLGVIRTNGGEVSAAVVRSTCGTSSSKGASDSTLWSGFVVVGPPR